MENDFKKELEELIAKKEHYFSMCPFCGKLPTLYHTTQTGGVDTISIRCICGASMKNSDFECSSISLYEDRIKILWRHWEIRIDVKTLTGVVDRRGNNIHFGDTLQFANKFEWYKHEWQPKYHFAKSKEERDKLDEEFDKLPMHTRKVVDHNDYQWLLNSEIQQYWEVVSKQGETK